MCFCKWSFLAVKWLQNGQWCTLLLAAPRVNLAPPCSNSTCRECLLNYWYLNKLKAFIFTNSYHWNNKWLLMITVCLFWEGTPECWWQTHLVTDEWCIFMKMKMCWRKCLSWCSRYERKFLFKLPSYYCTWGINFRNLINTSIIWKFSKKLCTNLKYGFLATML